MRTHSRNSEQRAQPDAQKNCAPVSADTVGSNRGKPRLGGEGFIKDILGKIKEGELEKDAISYRKALRAPFGIDEVLSAVCKHYGISKEEVSSAGQGEIRVYVGICRGTLLVIFLLTLFGTMLHFAHAAFSQT